MTERSTKAMSTRVTYNQPVSATEHDATTPDSPDNILLGANRQANGLEYGQGRLTNNQTRSGKINGETEMIIPEAAADANGQIQEPETSSSETVTTKTTSNKPLITIPSMTRLNSQSTSTAQTPSSTTSSRRSSNHAASNIPSLTPTRPAPPSPVSQPPSRRGSRTLSSALSTASSTHSTQRSPSPKNSNSSIFNAGLNNGSRPNVVRRQSSLAITYTASTEMKNVDAGKEGGTGTAEPLQVDGASSTSSPPISREEPVSAASVARKILDPLSAMNLPKPNSTTTTTNANSDTPLRRNFSSTSASTSGASTTSSSSNPVLRHATELELAYGIIPSNSTATADTTSPRRISRSGSTVSATQTSQFSTRPRSITQSLWGNRMRNAEPEVEADNPSLVDADGNGDATGFAELNPHDNISNIPPPKHGEEEECGDIAWALTHSIIVRDFGFKEGDKRFDRVPPEALLAVLRPPKEDGEGRSATSERGKVPGMGMGVAGGMRRGMIRGRSNGFPGSGAHYGGAAHYGGRWGAGEDDFEEDEDIDDEYDEEEEDDDGWGFPMGTVSGGPAPLGTTLLGGKRSRRELKNRVRAWNGLGGSKGVGGLWVSEETSEAEGESSGFYEEGEGVSGGEGISGDDDHDGEEVDPKDGDDSGLELDAFALMHTPSKAYHTFIGDEEHVSGRVEPPTYNPTSTYIPGSQLAYAAFPGHMDVDGVDADNDEDEGDSTDYDDLDRGHSGEEVAKPGMYRAIFPFEAEGPAEMSVSEGQMVRVLGKSEDGWVIAERTTRNTGVAAPGAAVEVDGLGEEHGLVPLGYLEVFQLDEADSDGAL